MENLIFRGRPDQRNACDQWSLVTDMEDALEFVVQERLSLDALQRGKPYLRLVRRMTVQEFMATAQPATGAAPIADYPREPECIVAVIAGHDPPSFLPCI